MKKTLQIKEYTYIQEIILKKKGDNINHRTSLDCGKNILNPIWFMSKEHSIDLVNERSDLIRVFGFKYFTNDIIYLF